MYTYPNAPVSLSLSSSYSSHPYAITQTQYLASIDQYPQPIAQARYTRMRHCTWPTTQIRYLVPASLTLATHYPTRLTRFMGRPGSGVARLVDESNPSRMSAIMGALCILPTRFLASSGRGYAARSSRFPVSLYCWGELLIAVLAASPSWASC